MSDETIKLAAVFSAAGIAMAAFCADKARLRRESLKLREELRLMAERLDRADSLLKLQRDEFESIRADIDETRRKDHDMRHHVALLRGLLRRDPEKASAYMEELAASPPEAGDLLCGNIAAGCVIGQYASSARARGITVETAVSIPDMPGISDIDLCVILSNLLENALEALSGDRETERLLLRISAGMTGNMLAINVDNSLRSPPRRLGALISGKRNSPGVGLDSVRAVAGKYDGSFWWKTENDMFRAFVVMKMKGEASRNDDSRM